MFWIFFLTQQTSSSNMALTAVAFQDHLIRSLSLSNPLRPKRLPGFGKTKTWKKDVQAVVDTGKGLMLLKFF